MEDKSIFFTSKSNSFIMWFKTCYPFNWKTTCVNIIHFKVLHVINVKIGMTYGDVFEMKYIPCRFSWTINMWGLTEGGVKGRGKKEEGFLWCFRQTPFYDQEKTAKIGNKKYVRFYHVLIYFVAPKHNFFLSLFALFQLRKNFRQICK